jgi:putative Holliday junction resolvase
MRALAIDYGKVRIGLAITDINKTIAYPYKTIKASESLEKSVDNVLKAIQEHISEIEIIIIGLPLLLKGGMSEMTIEVKEFAKVLQTKIKIPVQFIDERLSSVMAQRHLKENLKLNRKKRSKIIDTVSATLILQNFINYVKF